MIDNFDQIASLLKFETDRQFYFLQILQRKKDHKGTDTKLGPNNSSRLIRAYYIYSAEQLMKSKDEIVALCELFNARAGIALNRKDSFKIALEMLALGATQLKNGHYGTASGLYNTVCGQYHSDDDKSWILDLDFVPPDSSEIGLLQNFIYDQAPVGDKSIAVIPTKNGSHLITRPFDSREFSLRFKEVEIHRNNPTVLYVPDIVAKVPINISLTDDNTDVEIIVSKNSSKDTENPS